MANEKLGRLPTSTGNRRVFTYSVWAKQTVDGAALFFGAGVDTQNQSNFQTNSLERIFFNSETSNTPDSAYSSDSLHRDYGSWVHMLLSIDTTKSFDDERVKIYKNGILVPQQVSSYVAAPINLEYYINAIGYNHGIGGRTYTGGAASEGIYLTDAFFVDGQALTPDVFGFYKDGNGYISAGSTQSTDFRPGQWVPKKPSVIKNSINNSGGFGVNGFYLPMNDSSNFGADFHCTPNSIITLQEDLPQPKVSIASTAQAGLAYTDVLRADPYAANLLVACPFVSGGLGTDGTVSATIQGLGDYHRVLGGQNNAPVNFAAGSGTQATVAIGTGVYYGSSLGVTTSSIRPRAIVGTALTITGDYTVEFWSYTNSFDANGTHLVQYDTDVETGWAITHDFGRGRFLLRDSDGTNYQVQTTVGVATVGQWTHWAGVYERNQNRITLYVNGVAVGINTNVRSDYPSAQYSGLNRLHIGSNLGDGSRPMLGYIQDLRIYNTAKYKGGFDVPKPYTPVGIATWRAVPDTTANNFATLNPLIPSPDTLTNGNLTVAGGAGEFSQGTIGISSSVGGKWYFEFNPSNVGGSRAGAIGWAATSYDSTVSGYFSYRSDSGNYYPPNTAYGDSWTIGDTVGIALDADNGRIFASKNGVWQNSGDPVAGTNPMASNIFSGLTNSVLVPLVEGYGSGGPAGSFNFGQNPTFSGVTTAGTFTDSNGKGLFNYEPPTDFLALCEDNLPTPAIKNPGDYFKTVLYTGDGNTGRSITGIGFTPDLVWIKARHNTWTHSLFDSVRGPILELSPDNTLSAGAETDSLLSFNDDGFTYGTRVSGNQDDGLYVAWCWQAGAGTTSTNTDGSIDSVVSFNQDAGFSIAKYNGTGAAASVGHGLGKAPGFIIQKSLNPADGTSNWIVYHKSLGATKYLVLNTTGDEQDNPGAWNDTEPTDSIVNIGNFDDISPSGLPCIMYIWAEIEGYSKFGSYTGNGNADGPFVYCGFKPAFVMVKRTSDTGSWYMFDSSRESTNPVEKYMLANLTNIEADDLDYDFLSNGFKVRNSYAEINNSGDTIIFMAFAETPFKTANAK